MGRYDHLGDSGREIITTILTRPWEVAETIATPGRLAYLAALLVPLALLPLAAPLLAAGALPDLLINLLSGLGTQHEVTYHYAAVITPFFIAASILGLARVRSRIRLPAWATPLRRRGAVIACWVGLVALSGVVLGPLPWWQYVPLGSTHRVDSYSVGGHAAAAQAAVDLIPDGVPVSAGNTMGAHLSARRHIYTFPVVRDARWVVVDRLRPYMGDHRDPVAHAMAVARLRADPSLRVVYDVDGVTVFRRVGPVR